MLRPLLLLMRPELDAEPVELDSGNTAEMPTTLLLERELKLLDISQGTRALTLTYRSEDLDSPFFNYRQSVNRLVKEILLNRLHQSAKVSEVRSREPLTNQVRSQELEELEHRFGLTHHHIKILWPFMAPLEKVECL